MLAKCVVVPTVVVGISAPLKKNNTYVAPLKETRAKKPEILELFIGMCVSSLA